MPLFEISYSIPSLVFLIIWIGLPFWLYARRSQGWISIKRTRFHGERKECGLELEVAIFIFVIPSLAVSIFTLVYLLLIFFLPAQSRFRVTLEISALITDVLLIVYLYFAEKSITRKKSFATKTPSH